jgi:chromosome segregation ATPase
MSVKDYYQQQSVERAVAQRRMAARRGEQREAHRHLDRQRDDHQRQIERYERDQDREFNEAVDTVDRGFKKGFEDALPRGWSVTWK